jgi:hypothetical protein
MNELLFQLGHILYFIVLPMTLLTAVGFVLQRALRLDMDTLTKLNFWFVIPALIYSSVVTSTLTAGDIGRLVLFGAAMIAGLSALTLVAAIFLRVPKERRRALLLCVLFDNSGNYGIPLQELAFFRSGYGPMAVGIQVYLMIFQNMVNFTLGIFLAAGQRGGSWWKTIDKVLSVPPLYALAAGWLTVLVRNGIGDGGVTGDVLQPFWQTIEYVRGGFIPIAVLTLGAQLAIPAHSADTSEAFLPVLLRLIGSPLLALLLIPLLGFKGITAQVLLVSSAMPTAVNAALMAAYYRNHPSFVARAVFLSTVLSPLTVSLTVWLAQGRFLPWFIP